MTEDGGANIPAPNHSANDRSVSLLLQGDRVVVHTFGDEDWKTVLDDLRQRGLIDQANIPTSGHVAGVGRRAGDAGAAPRERVEAAVRLWDAAVPLGRTLSARHCRLRGVARDLPGPGALRHLAEAPVSAYRPGRHRRPALLAGVQDAGGRYVAVEITYLDPNARRAVDLRLSRKTVGAAPAGTAVRLDPLAPDMLVAEGVFTTLSASEWFGLPGWALLSTRNLRAWTAPPGGALRADRRRSRPGWRNVGGDVAQPPSRGRRDGDGRAASRALGGLERVVGPRDPGVRRAAQRRRRRINLGPAALLDGPTVCGAGLEERGRAGAGAPRGRDEPGPGVGACLL